MKRLLGVFIGLTLVMLSTGSQAGELALSHTDPAWKDGKGKVPDIGICEARNVGGKGMSPSIEVTGIPSGTVKLELHFTDENWYAGEGAHGVVGFPVPAGSKSVIVPSFKGETDKLPANIEAISSHEAQMLAGGVYLGPCSYGRGHNYTVYVYAKNADGKTLAKGKLPLGQY